MKGPAEEKPTIPPWSDERDLKKNPWLIPYGIDVICHFQRWVNPEGKICGACKRPINISPPNPYPPPPEV